MKKLVIFASGSGTNMQAIIDEIESGKIRAEIAGLIVNKSEIKAIKRARKYNIPVSIITDKDDETFSSKLNEQLSEWKPDLIVLAGFLKKIPDLIIKKYQNKIINIHPALLPKYGGKGFYGLNVHRAVLESGDKESGCTVHYVNEEYDKGPIISQEKVPVHSTDTPENLAKRVLKAEHKLLPSVIKKLINQP
ncbi:phosphoribosylglycinamide formyltransferase [Rhodohalobacter sulfatireducens]|uniref:Phosphoribosylglycinamide formyltransferase n=1 Tax=Rhodohalobacter sulfatireducens TaxID=2911366 RepID=A0ABS9KE97_9BACT|nr:phosphoribosylglycinamide formyltransferase [Rhodohalobacter sulfatireducens]